MKFTFPPKKIQIWGFLIGPILWITLGLLTLIGVGRDCRHGELCRLFSEIAFTISASPLLALGNHHEFLKSLPFSVVVILSFAVPIVLYGILSWLIVSIIWMIITSIRKKKNIE